MRFPLFEHSRSVGLALALGTPVAAALVRAGLSRWLHEKAPLLIFIIPIALTAGLTGGKFGILCTIVSGLIGRYFFLSPVHSLSPPGLEDQIRLGLFFTERIFISWLAHRTHQAYWRTRSDAERLRKQGEDLREMATSLEERVRERTAQLEEANLQLESFAYTVSHDLRSPLRAVQGFAQALLDDYGDKLDQQGQEYARRTVNAAARMDALIQDLLAYSRVQRQEIPVERVGLKDAVQTVLEQLKPVIDEKKAEVVTGEINHDVTANRAFLGQVLLNLIGNGLKFVAAGVKPRLELSSERKGNFVRIVVTDNGIGIAPAHHSRIFNIFERLHGGETYPGTGIGLAIVRKAVERMGGTFGVESDFGSGSRFWVELPAA